MKKKVVFFDGDGTLWYPKSTKRSKGPWWIYNHPKFSKNPDKHLIITPTTLETLKMLKEKGIITVVLSTHPHPPKEAKILINKKIKHFNLYSLFDEVHATRNYHNSKGEFILRILKRLNIPKKDALMVGDSYVYDYKPAKDRGIDAVLIKNKYNNHPGFRKVKNKIRELKEILKLIM